MQDVQSISDSILRLTPELLKDGQKLYVECEDEDKEWCTMK